MAENRGVRSSSVVFPILLIAIGALVLLRRVIPDFDPWPVLGHYWPLILIFVGAGMIWDRSHRPQDPSQRPAFPIGSTLGTLFFILLMVFLLWHGHAFAGQPCAFAVDGKRFSQSQGIVGNGSCAGRVRL